MLDDPLAKSMYRNFRFFNEHFIDVFVAAFTLNGERDVVPWVDDPLVLNVGRTVLLALVVSEPMMRVCRLVMSCIISLGSLFDRQSRPRDTLVLDSSCLSRVHSLSVGTRLLMSHVAYDARCASVLLD